MSAYEQAVRKIAMDVLEQAYEEVEAGYPSAYDEEAVDKFVARRNYLKKVHGQLGPACDAFIQALDAVAQAPHKLGGAREGVA